MGMHETIKDKPASSGEAAIPPPPVSGMDATATPRMALASVDLPKIEIPEAPKIALGSIEAPHIAPEIDELKPASGEDAADVAAVDADAEDAPAERAAPYVSRFTLLAAALALAAAFGGMVGALAAYGLARPGPAPAVAAGRPGLEEIQALKENVLQARVDLAALKVSIDSGNRSASAQLTRIGERIDRIERTQAEPAAKLNKALEALDRLSRADAAAQSKEVTGSVAPPSPPGAGPNQLGKLGVEGWVVRDVHRGTALIEGRMGIIEVDQGDVVPGLGRVDAIRKQDGRWVVVTSKGVILSAR
jgi:hypothetical protein